MGKSSCGKGLDLAIQYAVRLIVALVLCTLSIQTWSLLMCALVDQLPPRQAQLDKIQSLSVELAEPSFSDPVLEVSCSTVRYRCWFCVITSPHSCYDQGVIELCDLFVVVSLNDSKIYLTESDIFIILMLYPYSVKQLYSQQCAFLLLLDRHFLPLSTS